jgi:autotransporter-associated beta strand protein
VVCAALLARAGTGVWANVSGGYWADPANWQDGVVPVSAGTSAGGGDVADFTALGSGQTVTVTNTTFSGAMLFPNLPGGAWTVTGSALGLSNSPAFPAEQHGEIRVDGGTLHLAAPITSVNNGVAKTGAGALRLAATNTFTGITRLSGGTLSLANGAMLAYSPVVFASPSAALALEGDAQVGGVETLCQPQSAVALNGHTLTLGGETGLRAFGGTFANGSLVFARGSTQTFAGTQQVSSVRLENGSLNLGIGVSVAGWWRFDDPAQVGKDSGPRANHLVQSGTQAAWLASDAERGSVLALEGAGACLAGPNGGAVAGFPVSNMPFTVAFWLKPASDVNSTAGIYAWGVSQNYRLNMMRLNTPSSAKPLVQTNYGNNREIAYAPGLMDGAWHHVAVVYYGQRYQYYIDGEAVDGYSLYTPLAVEAGNFVLGKGITATTFKGRLDDVFIAQGALEYGQIAALRLSGVPPAEKAPADLLPETAQVEIAYNGKLRVAGDQALAALGGAGAAGGVELSGGTVLAVTGGGRFDGSVSGDGSLVKRGADTTLTLGGRVDATGAVGIAEGTLALANRLPAGLQAYYRFDDAANLGKDSSDNGYDLAASNAPAYAPGLFGGAASFTAAERDHLYAAVFPATVPTGNVSYTIAVWCNLKAGGNLAGAPVYWGKGNADNGSSAVLRFNTTTNIMTSNMGNNWTVNAGYDLAGDAPDGGWHHIVCTYDGATRERRVYFNGLPAGSYVNSSDLTVVGNRFWLGGAAYGTANFYDGLLDEVMIFNRALDETEISDIVTGVFSVPWGSRLVDRVVARYRFEDAADLGKDSGPHGYHLSATGRVAAAAGKIGQALDLSVRENYQLVQGYLNWTNSFFPEALPTGNAPVTITAWVNPVTNPNKEGCLVFWGTTLSGRKVCHLLRLEDSGYGVATFRLVDGVSYIGAVKVLSFDRGDREEGWHHVAAVVGPGGLRSFYVDGARVAANRVAGLTVDPGTFSVGYKPNAPTAWFQGLLDEVTVYDCALSRAELLETLRGRMDILPPDRKVDVAAGAVLDVGSAAQRVTGLGGAGELRVADFGSLTVESGTARFDGALTGRGVFTVRNGAVQSLAGTGTFSGSLAVSNATLLVENASGAVTGAGCRVRIQAGGRIGGGGTLAGTVTFEEDAGIVAGTEPSALTVDGPVTLGATGTVTVSLPEGFTGGTFTLVSATSLAAPSGVSGWSVSGVPPSWNAGVSLNGNDLVLKSYRRGLMISVR